MSLAAPYSLGPYNKIKGDEQWIRITEGCPHNCPYCYEPKEQKIFDIPEVVGKKVKVMDMNLLCKPEALTIIERLGCNKVKEFELICGIDYRFLTPEIAQALKASRFHKIRLAWDWHYADQLKVYKGIKMLLDAGYRSKDIMVFMICNWQIAYEENSRKLDLLKIWRVKVADCWFDNQYGRDKKPVWWSAYQIKDFRRRCRKHNHLVNYGYDPERSEKKLLLIKGQGE